ncbi:hypothetical protein ACE34W_004686 [Vibrio parahaemolyticus]
MKRLLIILVFFFLFLPRSVWASDVDEQNNLVVMVAGPDIVVEGFFMLLPKHSAAAIDLIKNKLPTESIFRVVPEGLLDTSSGLHLPESPYTDKNNPFYTQTNYYKVKNGTYPKSLMSLEMLTDEGIGSHTKTILYTGFFVSILLLLKWKTLVDMVAEPKKITAASRNILLAIVSIMVWYLFFFPFGENGISIIIMLTLAAFFAAAFTTAPFGFLGQLFLYDYSQPLMGDGIQSRIEWLDEVVGTVAVDSVIARITYDSHLENRIHNGLWDDETERVNSKFLIGLGERQKRINDELPEGMKTKVNTNCFISRDWIKNATNPECRWIVGEQNGINAENSRLSIDWKTPTPNLENLEPSARYIAHKLIPYVEDAINEYDDWVRSAACRAEFGEEVIGSRFNHSLVCAKRSPDGAIIEGEYHGYATDDGITYRATEDNVEVVNGRPMLPSLETLSAAIREISGQFIDNRSKKLLRENEKALSKIIYRGSIDAPLKLTGNFARLNRVHADSKTQAADALYLDITPAVMGFISSTFSAYKREIKQVKEVDYHSYLEQNYPTLAFVWFQNYKYVLLKQTAQKETLTQANRNPLYNNIEHFGNYVNAAVSAKIGAKVVESLGYDPKLLNILSNIMTLFFVVTFFANLFTVVPFYLSMLTLMVENIQKIFKFAIISIKGLIDILFDESDEEKDWFKMDIIRTSILNTFIKVIILSINNMIGLMMCFIGIVVSMTMISVSAGMSLESMSIHNIGNLILSGAGVLLILAINMYYSLRKIPFDLYEDACDLLNDDVNLSVNRGESMSDALSAANPKKFFL